jgi:penicillin V acylase-like amidase (Ntn superfamily)
MQSGPKAATTQPVLTVLVNPRDRFQRATYYLSVLSEPKTEREGIAGISR